MSEVAITETTPITIVESAATETIIPEIASHPGTEAAAFEAATAETTGKASTVETATTKTTVAAAHPATSVATTTATSAATCQRHCWCSQANGRNCQ
jgi:hypothetical protein